MCNLKNEEEGLPEKVARLAKELNELRIRVDTLGEGKTNPSPEPEPAIPESIKDALIGSILPFALEQQIRALTPPETLREYCHFTTYGRLIDYTSEHWDWRLVDTSRDFIKGAAYALQSTPVSFQSQNPNK